MSNPSIRELPALIPYAKLRTSLVLLLMQACMVADPLNPEPVASTTQAVHFSGYAVIPQREIWLQAARSPEGPFSTWPGARTRSQSRVALEVPLSRNRSIPLYAWSLSSAIPQSHWSATRDANGCVTTATYVRAVDRLGAYVTFDAASETSADGFRCFLAQTQAGVPAARALATCRSDQSPVLRIEQSNRFVGDVVIDSPESYERARCYTEIEGNLVVLPSAPDEVVLSRLERVSGSVSLGFVMQIVPLHQVFRCGREEDTFSKANRIGLPALTAIGGSLSITQTGNLGFQDPIEIGLDALTRLGGDLTATFQSDSLVPCGLAALTEVHGNVLLNFGGYAQNLSAFLLSLTSVQGAVSIAGAYIALFILPNLRDAGALSIDRATYNNGTLNMLETVTGNLELLGSGDHQGQWFPNLRSAGYLKLTETPFTSLTQVGSSEGLALHGLSVVGNQLLSRLTSGTAPELGTQIALSPRAPLTILGNPELPQAEICAFVSLQEAQGWSGPLEGTSCPGVESFGARSSP